MTDCKTEFLSHTEYAAKCAQAAREKRPLVTHVQARVFGHQHCARVVDAMSVDCKDYFKVSVEGLGTTRVPATQVRKCSGLDGKCVCAGEC